MTVTLNKFDFSLKSFQQSLETLHRRPEWRGDSSPATNRGTKKRNSRDRIRWTPVRRIPGASPVNGEIPFAKFHVGRL